MIDSAAAICKELTATRGNPPIVGGVAVHHLIASGGMGAVFQGVHLRLRIPVAVKFLFESPDNSAARFADEASLAAKINNPNVVRVYDVNKDGKFQFIVQEFVEGHTAEYHLQKSVRLQQPLSEEFALSLAADVARGLAAIHNVGFLHLDVKPCNVMVSQRDGVCKILDLGLAQQFRSAPGRTEAADVLPRAEGGTPGYASPEQLQFLQVGPSSDIYSLGVTVFELLAGRRAHSAVSWGSAVVQQAAQELPNIRSIRPDISEPTAQIIERCVRIDPEFRYQSAMELLSHIALASHTQVSKRKPNVSVPFSGIPGEFPSGAPLIYCVDDDAQVCMLLAELLTEAGYRAEVFTEGVRALAKMKLAPPDVVFLDYEMPVMNGLEICRAIRATERLKHIPVVFLTGATEPEKMKLAMNVGATDYLFKPVQAGELISRATCLTRIARAHRELDTLEMQYGNFRKRLTTMVGKEHV